MIFPSVTQVMQPWADFSKIPERVLAVAQDRGTRTHDACFAYARGGVPLSIGEDIQGRVDSFLKWFETQVSEVLYCEERLVHPAFAYHGEPDLIVRLVDGKIALVDIKTPAMALKTWQIQDAGYRLLCEKNKIKIDLAGSLRLDPDGGTPKMTWYSDTAGDLVAFLKMLDIYRYLKGA
jgi:hypothetical protein